MNFLIFIKQEIIFLSKNSSRFWQNILFFLISLALFFLLLQNLPQSPELIQILICDVIWFVVLFSLLLANSDFLAQDFEDGTLEQMLIFCPNFEIYILSKILANWIIYALPIIFLVPFLMMMSQIEAVLIKQFSLNLILASLTINFICAFCGCLSVVKNKAPMIAILALPLIIPIILVANSGMEKGQFFVSLKILAALSVVCAVIFTFAASKVMKILCE